MRAMTAANLRSAFGGESMAHMRYQIWGDCAEKENFPDVARLFRAISYAERVHATNHFSAMRDVGGGFSVTSDAGFGLTSTSENLQGAIDGETFEINEMYPAYMAVANLQEEKGAERSMHYAISAENIHAAMYQEAKQAVDGGKDVDLGPVQVCSVCGYTAKGDVPDKCPICGAARDRFKTFA